MTIANQLAYLHGTKEAIRQALISKGADIPLSMPFRQYATALEGLVCGGGGDDVGYGVYLKPNGVTIAAQTLATKGTWHTFEGKDYYVAIDYDDLVSVVSVYTGLSGDGEVLADLTRDGQTKSIPLNQVVTTFIDRLAYNPSTTTGLFYNARTFNQSLASWDTSSVTNMRAVFAECSAFNQDISNWDTGNVTDMYSMFWICLAFNQDIGSWDVSNVNNMVGMFNNCSAFAQDLSGWCVSKIPSKPSYFDGSTPAAWTTEMKPNWGAAC